MMAPKEKFATKLLAAIKATGRAADMRYLPEHFAFQYGGEGRFHLDNAYDEWARAGFFGKRRVLRRWVAGVCEAMENALPETFAAAQPHLMPYVRDANYWPQVALAMTVQGGKELAIPFERLGGDLTVSAAFDRERTIVNLPGETLAGWHVTLAEALKAAQFNLRMRTPLGFREVQPGVFASPYHDNYDASRIVLTEVITHLQVRGDPVAFAVHRDHLFITGADDEAGLVYVATAALELIQDRRRISGTPVRWQRGKWDSFSVPATSPVHEPLRRLRLTSLALDYSGQKELLEQQQEEDSFVASFSIFEPEDHSGWVSYSVWTEGIPTLLPLTDRIALVETSSGDKPTHAMVDWEVVEKVCGALMEKREHVPARVFVKDFPTAEMRAALKAAR